MAEYDHPASDDSSNQHDSQEGEYVSIKELAETMGMDRSHARRYILALGYSPHKRRTPDSHNQLTLALPRSEAEAVLAKRREQGFIGGGSVVSDRGFFYVIQLVPEIAPQRIKLGFATNVSDRLQQHRTAAPTAALLKCWPCRGVWERTAMDCMTREGCRLIANEVFECDQLDSLVCRGDKLFQQLPAPDYQVPLDNASPLKSKTASAE